jgi:pyridoxine 5'-phosphate synthase PdxJ
MDTPARTKEIADFLTEHGYTVEPTDEYLQNLAARLRNAGYDVTDPDDDGGAQAAANAGADQPAANRTARRAASSTPAQAAAAKTARAPEGGAKGDPGKA